MELSKIIEALFFASPDPVSTQNLARMVREAAAKFEKGQEPDNLVELKETTPEKVDALIAHYMESGRAFRGNERTPDGSLRVVAIERIEDRPTVGSSFFGL